MDINILPPDVGQFLIHQSRKTTRINIKELTTIAEVIISDEQCKQIKSVVNCKSLNGYHTSQNIVPFWIQPALSIMAPFNCINHEWFANTCSILSRKLLINNLMQSCMPNSFTYFKQKWKVQNGLRLSIVFSNYMYIWTAVKHNSTH